MHRFSNILNPILFYIPNAYFWITFDSSWNFKVKLSAFKNCLEQIIVTFCVYFCFFPCFSPNIHSMVSNENCICTWVSYYCLRKTICKLAFILGILYYWNHKPFCIFMLRESLNHFIVYCLELCVENFRYQHRIYWMRMNNSSCTPKLISSIEQWSAFWLFELWVIRRSYYIASNIYYEYVFWLY